MKRFLVLCVSSLLILVSCYNPRQPIVDATKFALGMSLSMKVGTVQSASLEVICRWSDGSGYTECTQTIGYTSFSMQREIISASPSLTYTNLFELKANKVGVGEIWLCANGDCTKGQFTVVP
jgi:hypothetical protein